MGIPGYDEWKTRTPWDEDERFGRRRDEEEPRDENEPDWDSIREAREEARRSRT